MNIYLLKTPFDATYKNVVDFIHYEGVSKDNNYNRTLADTLLASFSTDRLDIVKIDNRAFKRSVNLTSITIKYNYDVVRDYNYVIVFKNNKFYFYFINNIVSNNDNPENPSCTITLEWDAWNNNIDEIVRTKSTNSVEISHFDRYNTLNEYNSLIPNLIEIEGIDIPLKNEEIFGRSSMRYLPVYRVYQMKQLPNRGILNSNNTDLDPLITLLSSEKIESKPFATVGHIAICVGDSVCGWYNRNVIYTIVGVYDVQENTFINNTTVKSAFTSINYRYIEQDYVGEEPEYVVATASFNPEYDLGVGIPKLNVDSTLLEYIEGMYISYNAPFNYSYDVTNNILTFTENYITEIKSLNGIVILGDLTTYIMYDSGALKRRPAAYNYTLLYENLRTKYSFGISYLDHTGLRDVLNNRENYRINSPYNSKLDPVFYLSPFNFISVINNNSKIDMAPVALDDYYFNVNVSLETPQPQISLYDSKGGRIYSPTNIFIDSPVPYSFGTLAEASYMVRNGSQIETAKNISILTKIMNGAQSTVGNAVASGSIGGAIGAVAVGAARTGAEVGFQIAKYNALRDDLRTTPSTWYPSTGECDLLYQDRLRFVHFFVDDENLQYKTLVESVYYYGYDRGVIKDIFENTRIHFDYCQTSNCSIPELKNINVNDRDTIESIFNRGVTKWHILYDFDDDNLVNFTVPTKDKSILGNNIEHKFETNPTYKNWAST